MNLARKIFCPSQYTPTLNCMGYMSPKLDQIQMAFVEHSKNNKFGLFLDIGCGFGIATLPVINNGRQIIACDLEERHLEILKQEIPEEKLPFLTLIKGHFPHEIVFPSNAFDGINLSMVLHFLSPETIEKALKEIFICLKKGGRLYMTTSSPYQRVLSPFIPIYEQRRSVEEWPGYIDDIAKYVPHRAHLLPKRNIVFCKAELVRLVSKFGFQVQTATFFSREGMPLDLSLDGREYSGIICEKPRDSSFVFLEKNKERPPILAANIR
jgi:SAM-dependent methyltransferase